MRRTRSETKASPRADVVVLQSHRQPLPGAWMAGCLDSVQRWAERRGFDYRFEDDALLGRLPDDLRERLEDRSAVAADLARLAALEEMLAAGYRAAVWVDADTLICDPERLMLPPDAYALGREVWVQQDGTSVRAFVKVHNAFLLFRPGNPFLSFYRHAAERMVRAHHGPMVPQLVGPKLLTALHNLIGCPVVERAGVLPPAVARDVLAGSGQALALFRARSREAPAAVNLCASLVGRELSEAELVAAMAMLLDHPGVLGRRQ